MAERAIAVLESGGQSPPKNPVTRMEEVGRAELRAAACNLRRSGKSYEQISQLLGISIGGAHNLVSEVLDELNQNARESVREMRQLELDRLDMMHQATHELAAAGDVEAIKVQIKIAERRAKLLGLDAPTAKVDIGMQIDAGTIKGTLSGSMDDARAFLARHLGTTL